MHKEDQIVGRDVFLYNAVCLLSFHFVLYFFLFVLI